MIFRVATINCSKELVEFSALSAQYLKFLCQFFRIIFREYFEFFISRKFRIFLRNRFKCNFAEKSENEAKWSRNKLFLRNLRETTFSFRWIP